jgi:hypothetical protein
LSNGSTDHEAAEAKIAQQVAAVCSGGSSRFEGVRGVSGLGGASAAPVHGGSSRSDDPLIV